MRTPFQPPANPGAAATAVLLDTGAVDYPGRGKITGEHRARGVVYADQVVTVRHVWYAPGSASGRVLATTATVAGVATVYDFPLYAGRNVVEAVTTVAPAAWEVSTEVSDQAGAGSGGGGGLSGVTAGDIVFGAADGSGTWSDDLQWDDVAKQLLVRNQTNGAGEHARVEARTAGGAAGNPRVRVNVVGIRTADLIIDNATDQAQLRVDDVARLTFAGSTTLISLTGTTTPTASPQGLEVLNNVSASGIYCTTNGAGWFAELVAYANNGGAHALGLVACGTLNTYGNFLGSATTEWQVLRAYGTSAGLKIGTAAAVPLEMGTGNTKRFEIDANGNVIVGGAAMATTDTNGDLYVTHCPGVPTGVPGGARGKAARYDDLNDNLYVYDGAWNQIN